MVAESIHETVGHWLGTTSRASRIVIVVVVMVFALALVQFSGLGSETSMCRLFPDCQLNSDEINRIQIGLGQSGLDQFEIVNGEIHVPQDRRGEYLKVIGEQGMLPRSLSKPFQDESNLNPFLSRTQQQVARQIKKKQQICDMITRLPFVSQAWIEVDTAESGSVFDQDRWSAVLTIQPADKTQLSLQQVATVRQIVAGAFAGMGANSIVVTDLNAGTAYGGRENQENQQAIVQQVKWQRAARSEQLDLANRIRVALAEYEGLEISVNVKKSAVPSDNSSPAFVAPVVEPEVCQSEAQQEPRAGTNGKASIKDLQPTAQRVAFDPSRMLSPVGPVAGFPSTVSVDVLVPSMLVDSVFPPEKQGFFATLSSSSPRRENELQANFERLKSQIINKIRPLIPVSSFGDSSFPVSVELVTAEEKPGSGLARSTNWLGEHLPSVIVLLLGGTILLVVSRRTQASAGNEGRQELSLQSVPASSESIEEVLNATTEETKQQLAELIDQDPEAAASVIKSWIRNAA